MDIRHFMFLLVGISCMITVADTKWTIWGRKESSKKNERTGAQRTRTRENTRPTGPTIQQYIDGLYSDMTRHTKVSRDVAKTMSQDLVNYAKTNRQLQGSYQLFKKQWWKVKLFPRTSVLEGQAFALFMYTYNSAPFNKQLLAFHNNQRSYTEESILPMNISYIIQTSLLDTQQRKPQRMTVTRIENSFPQHSDIYKEGNVVTLSTFFSTMMVEGAIAKHDIQFKPAYYYVINTTQAVNIKKFAYKVYQYQEEALIPAFTKLFVEKIEHNVRSDIYNVTFQKKLYLHDP